MNYIADTVPKTYELIFCNYFQLNISQENIMEINLDPVQLGKFYHLSRQI